VKAVVGAREEHAAFAIDDLRTAGRCPFRRDPTYDGVEVVLGILVPADRPAGGRRVPLAFALGGGGLAARLALALAFDGVGLLLLGGGDPGLHRGDPPLHVRLAAQGGRRGLRDEV
jgi:hypothetical protein